MAHWRLLREAGVDIVTCQRGRLRFDDLGGIITAIIDQHGAREESIKLAGRVVSGQLTKALQGKRIGGVVFGYDRQLYDDSGEPVQRIRGLKALRGHPSCYCVLTGGKKRCKDSLFGGSFGMDFFFGRPRGRSVDSRSSRRAIDSTQFDCPNGLPRRIAQRMPSSCLSSSGSLTRRIQLADRASGHGDNRRGSGSLD